MTPAPAKEVLPSAEVRANRHRFLSALALGLSLLVLGLVVWLRLLHPEEAAEALDFLALSPRAQLVLGDAPELEPQERLQLSKDGLFRVVLRPRERIHGALELAAYVRGEDGRLMPWNIPKEATPEGSFQIRARVADLPLLHKGSWDIYYVLGYRGKLPAETRVAELTRAGSYSGGKWVLLHQRIEIGD